jgi:X-Pro dipeptidyl-peptidase
MRSRSARRVAAVLAAAFAVAAAPAAADAAAPSIVVENGVTQPVFGYTDAVRQRVWVEAPGFDTDSDGFTDRVAMDIIRPAASDQGLKVPVVMDASPYYTTLCRGNDSECIQDVDNDGLNDKWPLFYDNYFVPRGYAVVLLHMIGTGFSSGCPATGGASDNLSAKYGIDWLNGRVPGYDKDGNLVVAGWHNGKTGMIGKSYDGTLANATAATGVDGLSTIVPISAISSWYDYVRSNGIRLMGSNYAGSSLSNTVTNPARRPLCANFRAMLNATDGDETNDYTPFWAERDYNPHVSNVKASVFVVHGVNDNNVKPDHFSKWWYGLEANHVPRKIWLGLEGHVDPFDFRRPEWVSTLHRWFDHWLQDVPNGIMREPMADIERSADVWETFRSWPDPDAQKTAVFLEAVPDAVGKLSFQDPKRSVPDRTFLDTGNQSQNTMISNPTTLPVPPALGNRLVYLSPPLTAPLKISGTPELFLRASVNQVDTNLGVLLVDYGTATRVAWNQSGEGITTQATEDCWGENGANAALENACYRQTVKRVQTLGSELVTKGILDAVNRNSYAVAENLVPGQVYDFGFPLLPEDYVFQPGHQVGVILVGSYSQYNASTAQDEPNGATPRAEITVSGRFTKILLPIVGGKKAALAAGLAG